MTSLITAAKETRVKVNALGNIDRFQATAVYSLPALLEIKETINKVSF